MIKGQYVRGIVVLLSLLLFSASIFGGFQYFRSIALPPGSHRFRGNSWHVSSLAFSPDSKTLITVGWDCKIRLFGVSTGKLIREWSGPQRPQIDVSYHPTRSEVAVSSERVWLTQWNPATSKPLESLLYPPISDGYVRYSPNGKYLAASGMESGNVDVWDEIGQIHLMLGGHHGFAGAIAFSSDSRILATADQLNVHLWEVKSGKHLFSLPAPYTTFVTFSPNNKILAFGGTFAPLTIVEVSSRQIRATVPNKRIQRAVFSPNNASLIVACDRDILTYDMSGKLLRNVAPAFSPPDFLMRLIPPMRQLKRLPINNLILSPDGKSIAYSYGEMVVIQPISSLKLP